MSPLLISLDGDKYHLNPRNASFEEILSSLTESIRIEEKSKHKKIKYHISDTLETDLPIPLYVNRKEVYKTIDHSLNGDKNLKNSLESRFPRREFLEKLPYAMALSIIYDRLKNE